MFSQKDGDKITMYYKLEEFIKIEKFFKSKGFSNNFTYSGDLGYRSLEFHNVRTNNNVLKHIHFRKYDKDGCNNILYCYFGYNVNVGAWGGYQYKSKLTLEEILTDTCFSNILSKKENTNPDIIML